MVLNITTPEAKEDDTIMEAQRERRNGMGNIFEGIETEILHRLGWTNETLKEAVKTRTFSGSSAADSDCSDYFSDCERNADGDYGYSFHDIGVNSSQTDCSDDLTQELSCSARYFCNRKRRNGLADLFEALSVNQKQMFVHLVQNTPRTGGVTGCT